MRINFMVLLEYEAIGGMSNVLVGLDDYERFKRHPIDLVALKLGVRVSEYLEWVEAQGRVRCVGRTRKGRRCKHDTGRVFYSCSEWVCAVASGEYCKRHGGE